MQKSSLLFVVRSFSRTGAQPIRFRQILSHLAGHYDIHVLELTHGQEGVRNESGITIHSLGYSLPGRFFNRGKIRSGSRDGTAGRSGKLKTVLTRLARNLLFPDSLITEGARLRREAVRLAAGLKCDVVVLSAFPFTVLLCINVLKRKTAARVILDVGDPFYKNSKNGFIRDKLAFAFENRYLKSVDRLIVTNAITRDHYLSNYTFLRPEQVGVVSHGVSDSFIASVSGNEVIRAPERDRPVFRLAYAGQLYMKMREPFELYKAIWKLNDQSLSLPVRLDMYGSYNGEFLNCGPAAPFVSFKGLIAHDDLIKLYLDYDAIVFIDNAYGMQTPGKVFEIALINRPVLCIADRSDSPALSEISEYNHVVATGNRSDMIVSAIRKIMSTEFSFRPPKDMQSFSWDSRSQEYKKIIDGVING